MPSKKHGGSNRTMARWGGLVITNLLAAVALLAAGCAGEVSGQREIRLRFHVDSSFEGLAYVTENPDLDLEFGRVYDIKVANGEAQLPKGFVSGPQPVFWRVVEVVDSTDGKVLSSGNDPPVGVTGVRNLLGLSGPGARSGYYFVISSGRRAAFELVEAYRKQFESADVPRVTCRLLVDADFFGRAEILEDPSLELRGGKIYDVSIEDGILRLPAGSLDVLGRRGMPEHDLDIIEVRERRGSKSTLHGWDRTAEVSSTWSGEEGDRFFLTVSQQ